MSQRKGSEFAGLSVAITTPFSGGEVDYVRLREQLEFQIDAGTRCIVPVGTTGESPTLSHDEHEKVIAEVIQCVAGRAKVMAGTGSNSTAEALRLTKRAAAEGADATLQVAPYYNKPMQEGFYQHFKAIAEAVDIPVCVYNIPGRSGKEIDVETIQRLSDVPGITMVKEATGKLDQCSSIIGSTDLTVLCGDDSLTLPMMSVGAEGVISVVGNLVPADMIQMVRAARNGDFVEAAKHHHRLFKLCQNMLGLATNPIPIKAAMQLVGRDTGELRLPMTPLDDASLEQLKETLFAYGVGAGAVAS
jgi:4-hydroxy-tetrahydrodipicolinate synthase